MVAAFSFWPLPAIFADLRTGGNSKETFRSSLNRGTALAVCFVVLPIGHVLKIFEATVIHDVRIADHFSSWCASIFHRIIIPSAVTSIWLVISLCCPGLVTPIRQFEDASPIDCLKFDPIHVPYKGDRFGGIDRARSKKCVPIGYLMAVEPLILALDNGTWMLRQPDILNGMPEGVSQLRKPTICHDGCSSTDTRRHKKFSRTVDILRGQRRNFFHPIDANASAIKTADVAPKMVT